MKYLDWIRFTTTVWWLWWCLAIPTTSHSFHIQPTTRTRTTTKRQLSNCFQRQCKSTTTETTTTTTTDISSPPPLPEEEEEETRRTSSILSQKPLETTNSTTTLQMFSFYSFQPIPDPLIETRNAWFDSMKDIPGLRGTIYIASEGINAQMAIPPEALSDFLSRTNQLCPFHHDHDNQKIRPNLGDIVPITTPTFQKFLVRERDYVLRDGIRMNNLDWNQAGTELDAHDWQNALQPPKPQNNTTTTTTDTPPPLLIDCRNWYESEQGTFQKALSLDTETFSESWKKLDELLLLNQNQNKKKPKDVYIFCTGGIRCVKVGAYLKQHWNIPNVYRLKDGIIGYQKWFFLGEQEKEEENHPSIIPNKNNNNLWEGENFLFDKRRLEKEKEVKDDDEDKNKE